MERMKQLLKKQMDRYGLIPVAAVGVLTLALLVTIGLRIGAAPAQANGDDSSLSDTSGGKNEPGLVPHAVDSTKPENMLHTTAISVDGVTVEGYEAEEEIVFGDGDVYTEQDGILAFRGNNYRDTAAYGTASMTEKTFGESWAVATSSLSAPDGASWTGSGWTGQALVIRWSKETRQNMNLYDTAKEKNNLVEVIYPTMDGRIYFLDLETGERTRDPMYVGYTFKGCGSLDPRGYPILYAGAGYDSFSGKARAFVINLLDCSIMYQFGAEDHFSMRGLSYFDASPLVDAETDQLIYPGENGILYIMKLNTQYDAEAGTLSINPDPVVKWRYEGERTSSAAYWLGMEDSPVIWKGYLYIADNGGHMMCINLKNLEVIWVQDVLDDTNCTPVLELENGHPYIYMSTSFHGGWRAGEYESATIPVWKLDAITGEIVWQTDYTCYTAAGVSGGVQGTLAIGKNELSDLIFVPVAKTTNGSGGGILAALNKETGETVWELKTNVDYSWSSPVIVYDDGGHGYVLYPAFYGTLYLLDGETGETLDTINLQGHVEASPVVYENTVVIGTRDQRIYGITLQ